MQNEMYSITDYIYIIYIFFFFFYIYKNYRVS
nr:MAG TPA: hypothetical protein [Caudoviricetes sp.]